MAGSARADAARARFLAGGARALAADEVRPRVLASWERAVARGADLDRAAAAFVGQRCDDRIAAAAGEVFEVFVREHGAAVATGPTVGLVDDAGVVRVRCDLDPDLAELLDGMRWAPGYRHAEPVMGATAAAIARHDRAAVLLEGPEHLHPGLLRFREAAAPVGATGATVVVLAPAHETGGSLLGLAVALARQVADSERAAAHRAVLAVLDAVTAAEAEDPAWVIAAVDEQQWTGRGAAALDAVDQRALHDALTASVLLEDLGGPRHVDLPGGACAEVDVREVFVDDRLVGCVLVGNPAGSSAAEQRDAEARRRQGSHVAPLGRRDYAADRRRGPAAAAAERDRLRRSRELFSPWSRARQEVTTNLARHRAQLLLGEPGTGKRTLALDRFRRLYPDGVETVVDCSTVEDLRRAIRVDGRPRLVVLRHLGMLTPLGARCLDEVLRPVAGSPQVAVVGCLDATSSDPSRPYGLVLRHFHETVHVPALRQRTDELAEIAASVLRGLAGARSLRLSHQVVRVLEGYAWPGNVSELEDVLRYVVARKPVGVVQPPDLPALCFAGRTVRLSMLETAQADAIIQALYEAGGNRYRAAESLGIARSTLYRKIDAFGISYIA